MAEFSYEILAAILVLVFILALCFEYLWLYILSRKNEETDLQMGEINARIHSMLESFLYSPTPASREAELDALVEYIGEDAFKKNETVVQFIQLMRISADLPEEKQASLGQLYDRLDPIPFYAERLEKGNRYEKSYAVRRLADFMAREKIGDIRPLLEDKHADLVYNAAMALSELGDEESVVTFAKKCESNHLYSHRVLLELLQAYSGDRVQMVRRLYESCNDYIRATAVKAYTGDRLEALAGLYMDGMDSRDGNLKIACVKALAQFGDPQYEHTMAVALNDKNWIVRLAAVSGLEKIGTPTALEALVHATQDEEWWVRSAAARAIVQIDEDLVYVEKVLGGYDKYAADAVKNALYKQVKMNGGALQ